MTAALYSLLRVVGTLAVLVLIKLLFTGCVAGGYGVTVTPDGVSFLFIPSPTAAKSFAK